MQPVEESLSESADLQSELNAASTVDGMKSEPADTPERRDCNAKLKLSPSIFTSPQSICISYATVLSVGEKRPGKENQGFAGSPLLQRTRFSQD